MMKHGFVALGALGCAAALLPGACSSGGSSLPPPDGTGTTGSGGLSTINPGGGGIRASGGTLPTIGPTGGTGSLLGNSGGTSSVSPSGGTSSAVAGAALPMDSTGWVDAASNSFGIQGAWYWYSDSQNGGTGKTALTGVVADTPPYVAGKGMCLSGTTPGGQADSYATWGAGIGLNLGQTAGSTASPALANAPQCYTITVSGTTTLALRAKLLGTNPMPTGSEAPGKALTMGANEVCVNNVAPPTWCTTAATCPTSASLASGIAAVQVQVESGATGGAVDFCITSIVPHN